MKGISALSFQFPKYTQKIHVSFPKTLGSHVKSAEINSKIGEGGLKPKDNNFCIWF